MIFLLFISIVSSTIIEGKPHTFGPTIEDNELVLVGYHNDKYNEMEKTLKQIDEKLNSKIPLLSVDCKTELDICQTENIKQYPCYFVYYKIEDVTKYFEFNDQLMETLFNRINGISEITQQQYQSEIKEKKKNGVI